MDSDFNNLNEQENNRGFIFYTDTHDLETMFFTSDALDTVVDTHCKEEKLHSFLAEEENSLRDILFERSSYLGYLKWANNIHNWGLIFKPKEMDKPELKIEEFIPKESLKFVNIATMVKTVFNYSRGKVTVSVDENTVIDVVTKMAATKADFYQLCNGHDIAYIFTLGLKKKLANLNSNAVSANQVEKDLVLAYEARHFSTTTLYKNLKKYELTQGCRLLDC